MTKYPRIHHITISPGKSKDDKVIPTDDLFIGVDVVITEKIDGSNVCMTREACYSRSHSGPPTHASFDLFKALHAEKKFLIPKRTELFGEWCYALHSLYYDKLPSYFLLFGARENNQWLSWDETDKLAKELDLCTVPVVYKTKFSNHTDLSVTILSLMKEPSYYGTEKEGLVLRLSKNFTNDNFKNSISKYVRKNHVTKNDIHWKNKEIIRNRLL